MTITLRTGQRLTKKKWQRVVDLVTENRSASKRISRFSQPEKLRPRNADSLAIKAAYVILNSGMKNEIAMRYWPHIRKALRSGSRISYGHEQKVKAMKRIWRNRQQLFSEYRRHRANDDDLVNWCATLPWIGKKTKYHLAMNCGADVCKPDVHLCRLAKHQDLTVRDLCEKLSGYKARFVVEEGFMDVNRVSVVDRILWNALKDGILTYK